MSDTPRDQRSDVEAQPEPPPGKASSPSKKGKKKHISMHEGIGAWADCCSCEAEPYWREHAEEMGVDFNEYEEEEYEQEEAAKPPAGR